MKYKLLACLFIIPVLLSAEAYCYESLALDILDEELTIDRYPAKGDQVVLFIDTGMGLKDRTKTISSAVAERGIELWYIDLVESLFLPRATSTFREMDGRYVAGLISRAHAVTGKNVTVLTRAYASIPSLRGIRKWQQQQSSNLTEEKLNKPNSDYLNGIILLSPELYMSIPELGLEPVFAPIASATNVPVMLLQSGKRGNRWQMEKVVAELQKGGSQVYSKLFPGVTGIFYAEDKAVETAALIKDFPREIERAGQLLENTSTPIAVTAFTEKAAVADSTLDMSLKPYKGNPIPPTLNLSAALDTKAGEVDYRGKVTLVNFWATWCRPCVEEIPSLNRLRKQMHGKPFQLISVDYAEAQETIRVFMKEVDVDFPVLLDTDGAVSAQWNVVVFPSTFVINPEGKIVYGVKGGIHWDTEEVIKLLDNLLDQNSG